MPDVAPGREEEFRRLQRWLAFNERLDHLIEAAEAPHETPASTLASVYRAADPAPVSSQQSDHHGERDTMWDRIYVDQKLRELARERLARRPIPRGGQERASSPIRAAEAVRTSRGLRAHFAARLARLALALHREAAAEAAFRPEAERPR